MPEPVRALAAAAGIGIINHDATTAPQLFPHDKLIVAMSISFNRFTIKYPNETLYSRFFWSMLLGYLAFVFNTSHDNYWILMCVHLFSFHQFLFQLMMSGASASNNSGGSKESEGKESRGKGTKKEKNSKNNAKSSNIVQTLKATTVLIALYLVIFYTIYSIARPQGVYSFTQTPFYEKVMLFMSSTAPSPSSSPSLASSTILSSFFNSSSVKEFITSSNDENGNVLKKLLSTINNNTLVSLLPIQEIKDAHNILSRFMPQSILDTKIFYLLFVTLYIQTAMGYLGIDFLRNEQNRKNALIKIEDEAKKLKEEEANEEEQEAKSNSTSNKQIGKNSKDQTKTKGKKHEQTKSLDSKANKEKDPSKKFRQSAGKFIFCVATPYMLQIVGFGAVNMYAYHCFRDDIHRTIRLNDLFQNDGQRFVATSTTTSSLSPGAYAQNAETVVNTVYDIFNQNFFSLPKLMLLPQVIAKQPLLLVQITPLILLSDYVKSTIVSTITTETERISKEVKEKEALRNRIEQYDIKNSELIQRSGFDSILFTEERWIELTESIQELKATASIMKRSKMYFAWIQRHFVMMALVDCALAKLIAVGKIGASDIFVYARAIEDFIGFILMRSRAESELASMSTSIEVLSDLKQIWDDSEQRHLLKCNLSGDGDEKETESIKMKDLSYSRGSASVQIDDIELSSGIYAVTGANGSGKSTLFRLLTACDTNRKSIDMDNSIIIKSAGTVMMSSQNVVEIAQNFYWPLNTAPADWIYYTNINQLSKEDRDKKVSKLSTELKALKFYPETESGSDLATDLITVKDDWFADLSGGQKSKVELVRKVFLEDRCPNILLIDETFAPLDPDSKSLIMQKLKDFCSESIVLVIYHADVKDVDSTEGTEKVKEDACVQSSNFFDANLHVENG
eukprot:CAMPEP_0203684402 /NCGR_PEP_ID=MMETSP0090-20130426/48020_1 /ASSEMBLY_ACC=CAM_ASM_001088 /TAXON_ID=426623 /ORGANISM="Chaetoceros affinis, Strain CCMP159" /LENGTH=905 /DNA_ID=CAMNT_0050553577 /DNA_START=366 /DNA_END=3079 /DNA_ORIENTATION=+